VGCEVSGFAQKVKYHPRQWVDYSDPFYFEAARGVCANTTHGQWVDGSDPFYFDLPTQMLAQDNFIAPIRKDLNNPPTARWWDFQNSFLACPYRKDLNYPPTPRGWYFRLFVQSRSFP
jgi:hypothetical protein